ncbi:MAG: ABC transporter permease [candidate division KSB1 bacterium]|nr:ABC transporter permease [candidate division KSB1 bacterium]MDZ7274395.1 ABC transporter permease [candidate division KSB1 bacterium]MDZ7284943.1 ABC transporter permease [candidate division KSB1 bacterium]MDZ7297636.1 ABC transporter permease [candidate division KSB1 bacterium]MDZ7348503.1 ABC transporter permease [candidate division KSB1 bacterium]
MRAFLRVWIIKLAPAVIAFAVATLLAALLLLVSGYQISLAFRALLEGAFGSAYALSETLVKSIPLLLTGAAVALAFRAGVWNIGAEGQLLAGALAASALAATFSAFGGMTGVLGIALLLLAGGVAGGLWAGLAGVMKTRRSVPEVVSTILLNFIAIELVRYAVHGPLMETAGQFPQSDALDASLRLTRLFPPTRLHAGLWLALVIAVLCYLLIQRTVFGFEMQATAANPRAARFAAIDTARVQLFSLIISGAVAGLAGVIELAGVTYRVYDNFSPGYGYTAIAVALMARLNPLAVIFSALLFGALENGAAAMQRQANVSAVISYVIQGLVVLTMAVAGGVTLKSNAART